MMHVCQCGFKCPYLAGSEDGDIICIHPYRHEDVPEDEEFGLIDEIDCPLLEYPSPIYDLLDLCDALSRGSCPSQDRVDAEEITKKFKKRQKEGEE